MDYFSFKYRTVKVMYFVGNASFLFTETPWSWKHTLEMVYKCDVHKNLRQGLQSNYAYSSACRRMRAVQQ